MQLIKIKELNAQKGVTLISLLLTIIMLLITTLSVTSVINSGLFEKAEEAVNSTQQAIESENQLSTGVVNIDGNMVTIDNYVNHITSVV